MNNLRGRILPDFRGHLLLDLRGGTMHSLHVRVMHNLLGGLLLNLRDRVLPDFRGHLLFYILGDVKHSLCIRVMHNLRDRVLPLPRSPTARPLRRCHAHLPCLRQAQPPWRPTAQPLQPGRSSRLVSRN